MISFIARRNSCYRQSCREIGAALLLTAAMVVTWGCKPENVSVQRRPDSASSVANIQASQFEQVVPFPKREVLPTEPMESVEQFELAAEIASNSDLVISRFGQLAKVRLACDADGICWLSNYIDEKHDAWTPTTVNSLVDTLGSYFGECLRKEFGGQWYKADKTVELRINPSQSVFPFDLLRKHIENAPNHTILDAFQEMGGAVQGRPAHTD